MFGHVGAEAFPATLGRFTLVERIGSGGMAEVFRVRAPGPAGFEKPLVLKRLLPHLASNPRVNAQFVAEARLAATLRHQNIVQIHGLEALEDGTLAITMEDVDGVDLATVVARAAARGLRLPSWFAVHVAVEVANALTAAHESPLVVVHRDVTPSNVFVSWAGEVKLADFGIAKALEAPPAPLHAATEAGARKGKTAYMAPEQFTGLPVDVRTDLFALGALTWELLTGRRLFEAQSDYATMLAIAEGPRVPPSELVPGLPAELDATVLRALEPSPEDRWPSTRGLRGALIELRAHLRPILVPEDVEHIVAVVMGRREASARVGLDRSMDVRFRALHRTIERPSTPSSPRGPFANATAARLGPVGTGAGCERVSGEPNTGGSTGLSEPARSAEPTTGSAGGPSSRPNVRAPLGPATSASGPSPIPTAATPALVAPLLLGRVPGPGAADASRGRPQGLSSLEAPPRAGASSSPHAPADLETTVPDDFRRRPGVIARDPSAPPGARLSHAPLPPQMKPATRPASAVSRDSMASPPGEAAAAPRAVSVPAAGDAAPRGPTTPATRDAGAAFALDAGLAAFAEAYDVRSEPWDMAGSFAPMSSASVAGSPLPRPTVAAGTSSDADVSPPRGTLASKGTSKPPSASPPPGGSPPTATERGQRLPAFPATAPSLPKAFVAIRDDGATLGPLELTDLGRVLREPRVARLSLAGEQARNADDARVALGMAEPTTAELQVREVSLVGTLEPRGLTHVLCRLAVQRGSARVVVIGDDERLFADVVDGVLTFVSSGRNATDPLTLGLTTNLLGRDELESLALGALRGRLRVLEELRRHRPRLLSRLMSDRAETMLRMPTGRYAVGQPVGVPLLPPSTTLQPTALHRLHELVQRTHMAAAIWAWLGPRAEVALRPTGLWNEVTDLLGLKRDEMIWASRLAQGASATEVARSAPDDAASVAALAWVMVEAEALASPPRP